MGRGWGLGGKAEELNSRVWGLVAPGTRFETRPGWLLFQLPTHEAGGPSQPLRVGVSKSFTINNKHVKTEIGFRTNRCESGWRVERRGARV